MFQFLFGVSRIWWKVQFAYLGLVEEIGMVYCKCMRNCGNEDPQGLWLDWYPQGTSLLSQDSLPSLALSCIHCAPRVLQGWKALEEVGQALCWGPSQFSGWSLLTPHKYQLYFISLGAEQLLRSASAWGYCAGNTNLIYYLIIISVCMHCFHHP